MPKPTLQYVNCKGNGLECEATPRRGRRWCAAPAVWERCDPTLCEHDHKPHSCYVACDWVCEKHADTVFQARNLPAKRGSDA